MMHSLRASMLREALLKFTRELSARLVIRSVSQSTIRVNEETYSESLALTAEELVSFPEPVTFAVLPG